MIDCIEKNRRAIEDLCRQHHVAKLEIFGSGASDDFDPTRSDVDLLVEFDEAGRADYADAYFGFLERVQELLGRNVDLVIESAVKNPYFLRGIDSTRSLLYAA